MDSRQLSLSLEYEAIALTLQQLDRHLFKCADIIRNTVDKTDHKDFIVPIVFQEDHGAQRQWVERKASRQQISPDERKALIAWMEVFR